MLSNSEPIFNIPSATPTEPVYHLMKAPLSYHVAMSSYLKASETFPDGYEYLSASKTHYQRMS